MQAYFEVVNENSKMAKLKAYKPLKNNAFDCPVMSRAHTGKQPRLTGKEANDNSIIFFFSQN